LKKQLGVLLRVLVSVGILAYLFNGIFQNEVQGTLKHIADSPSATSVNLARNLRLRLEQVDLIRAKCLRQEEVDQQLTRTVDLKQLPWRDRLELVWKIGPRGLWEVFQQVSAWWFALGIACIGAVCYCGIVRWQWILRVQGLDLRFWRASSIFFIGLFFNVFMLGSTGGDVIKAWYVAHETHHKKAEAVATVVVDRVIGLLVLFIIALVMMALFYHRVFDDVKLRWFAVITLAVVVTTVGGTALTFWRGFADKFFGLRGWLQRLPKYDTLRRLVEACRVYASHPVVLAKTTLITVGVHMFSMLSIVCIGRGLGIVTKNGIVDYFLYLPIINSVTAIPISISGFGVREGMYQVMFGEVGVAASLAVAMSLIGYFVALFWSVVGAVFYMTHRKEIPPAAAIATEE
jgi:uncharacterized protein (TIRG00374 family)